MPAIFGIYCDFFFINRRSLSVGTTEGSASAELTTEGSAESLAEGTFGRSLMSVYVTLKGKSDDGDDDGREFARVQDGLT